MASFDENGKYIKTNWKAGDRITATKLNKIEESIEAVNDNDISRHVEADTRLDALEAKDVAHDKEFTNVRNLIADNKAAAELGDYEINSRMQFLEDEINDGIADITDMSTSINNTITNAETNLNAIIADAEANLNDVIREAEEKLENGGGNVGPRLDSLEEAVSSLQTETSSLQTEVSSLQAELGTNVSTLASNIDDIRGVL